MKKPIKYDDSMDQVLKSYYSCIGQCHVQNIIDELDAQKQEINDLEIPESLDEWFRDFMYELKRKELQVERKRRVKKWIPRVSIAVMVTFISLSIVGLSVEAIRVKVYNLFMSTNPLFTSVRIHEVPMGFDGNLMESYLPKGFIKQNSEVLDNETRIIRYTNESDSYIMFTLVPNKTDFQIDTERGKITEVFIGELKGIVIEKDNGNAVLWHNDTISYYILSDLEIKTLLEIAEKIEIN